MNSSADIAATLIAIALKGGEVMLFDTKNGWRLFLRADVTGAMMEVTPKQARNACRSLKWLMRFVVIKGLEDLVSSVIRLADTANEGGFYGKKAS